MKLHSRGKSKSTSRLLSLHLWGPRAASMAFILVASGLFLISAVQPGSMQGVRGHAGDLFAPLFAAVNKPVQQAAEYVRAATGIAELQAENARLRSENVRLKEWYQTALVLQSENDSLKELLKLNVPRQHSYISARVIADSGNAYVKSLMILAGSEQNVIKGNAVVSGEGIVGRVIDAGKRSARILLLTDINSRIPVEIQGTGYNAILAGNNEDMPDLIHLPPDTKLVEGTRVVTSGHGGMFPYGLPVGEIRKDSGGTMRVMPFANMQGLSYVRVLDQGHDPNLKTEERQAF